MKIGKTKLDAVNADITKLEVDAVVNPANNMLWTGGGISVKINREGGHTIETEALAKAPADIGTAVATGAGKLPAKYVIHAVISGQDLATDEQSVRKAVRSSLAKADELRCRSVAIPIPDSASFDVEVHVAARIIVDETVNYLLEKTGSIETIQFVEHEDTLKGIFDTALHEKFTKH